MGAVIRGHLVGPTEGHRELRSWKRQVSGYLARSRRWNSLRPGGQGDERCCDCECSFHDVFFVISRFIKGAIEPPWAIGEGRVGESKRGSVRRERRPVRGA